MSKRSIAFALGISIIFGFAILLLMPIPEKIATGQKTIKIASALVSVDVAATEVAREQGLSGRASLPEGRGMFFIFDTDGMWGFWMKDMNFSLDIIWIDVSGKIVTIAPSLSPASYPKVFYPSVPARYVLEVPAGFADAHHIVTGAKVNLY